MRTTHQHGTRNQFRDVDQFPSIVDDSNYYDTSFFRRDSERSDENRSVRKQQSGKKCFPAIVVLLLSLILAGMCYMIFQNDYSDENHANIAPEFGVGMDGYGKSKDDSSFGTEKSRSDNGIGEVTNDSPKLQLSFDSTDALSQLSTNSTTHDANFNESNVTLKNGESDISFSSETNNPSGSPTSTASPSATQVAVAFPSGDEDDYAILISSSTFSPSSMPTFKPSSMPTFSNTPTNNSGLLSPSNSPSSSLTSNPSSSDPLSPIPSLDGQENDQLSSLPSTADFISTLEQDDLFGSVPNTDDILELTAQQDDLFGSVPNTNDAVPEVAISTTTPTDPAISKEDLSSPYTLTFSREGEYKSSRFGSSVAISSNGKLMAVGAKEAPNESGETTGAVYLYSLDIDSSVSADASSSKLLQVIYGESPGGEFGNAIALSHDGNRIIIGSRSENILAGGIRVYSRSNSAGTWDILGGIMRGQNSLDRAGWSVAISGDGNVVAFGAPKGGSNRGGAVFSYQFKDGLGWKPNGQVIGGLSEDNVGFSVSLSYDGSLIAVGSPKGSSTFGPANAGKNAVYEMRKPIWAVFTSPIHGETTDDSDGTAVAFSQDGTILVTGARGRDGNKGYCRVYERNKQSSQFKLIHTIAGQHAEEQMGSSAAVSSDGNVIACGGTNGSWKGGTNSGVVRLWDSVALSESIIWPREKTDSHSEGSYFGSSVALSSDGRFLIVGAPAWSDDIVGSLSGAVQVFGV